MNDVSLMVSMIDLVIGVTVVEGLLLVFHHRLTGRGVAPRDFAANMVSGLCLMLALRGVVHGADAPWLALCLLAAGIAHGADILRRWRHAAPPAPTGRAAP
jgi:hypothetical protein